ncbi:MAG: hypothetical protein KGN76_06875, partial [Acidobacteriota bacterium]|nr:hypothetical protein [Acidobacteriota bacterium]
VTAANWPVVLIEFITDTTFKGLFAVPVVGAAIIVGMLLGGDIGAMTRGSLREAATTVGAALRAEPLAFGSFVAAFLLVLGGGSVLTFLVKGGTVSVLVEGEAVAGPIERPPLRMAAVRRAARFSLDGFTQSCLDLFRPFLALGLLLMGVYLVSGAVYLLVVYAGYTTMGRHATLLGWPLLAAVAAIGLALWVTVVNLLYLLVQVALVAGPRGRSVRGAIGTVAGFLRRDLRVIASVFGVVLVLIVLATVASALAWSGVGLIAFVPFVGVAVVPLQLAGLVVRGVVFEYLELTALSAYVALFQSYLRRAAGGPGADAVSGTVPPIGRPA